MSTNSTQETCSDESFHQGEEWKYFEEGILKKTRTAGVCVICQHFNYLLDMNCITHLFCYFHQHLIPRGDLLTSHYNLWLLRHVKEIGLFPEGS